MHGSNGSPTFSSGSRAGSRGSRPPWLRGRGRGELSAAHGVVDAVIALPMCQVLSVARAAQNTALPIWVEGSPLVRRALATQDKTYSVPPTRVKT